MGIPNTLKTDLEDFEVFNFCVLNGIHIACYVISKKTKELK